MSSPRFELLVHEPTLINTNDSAFNVPWQEVLAIKQDGKLVDNHPKVRDMGITPGDLEVREAPFHDDPNLQEIFLSLLDKSFHAEVSATHPAHIATGRNELLMTTYYSELRRKEAPASAADPNMRLELKPPVRVFDPLRVGFITAGRLIKSTGTNKLHDVN